MRWNFESEKGRQFESHAGGGDSTSNNESQYVRDGVEQASHDF